MLASNLRRVVRGDSLECSCDLSLKGISSDSDLIKSWLEASRKLEAGQELTAPTRMVVGKWELLGGLLGGWVSLELTVAMVGRAGPLGVVTHRFLCVHTLWPPTLCNPMDCSPPGSSVHRIFPAKTQEQVVISSSKGSSWPRDRACLLPCRQILYSWVTREAPEVVRWRLNSPILVQF